MMGLKRSHCKCSHASSYSPKLFSCRSSSTIFIISLFLGSLVYFFAAQTHFLEPILFAQESRFRGDLLEVNFPWNKLCFGPTFEKLKIAVFAKTWPMSPSPGGMERHASTLCRALADKGHEIHVFTTPSDRQQHKDIRDGNLHVIFVENDHGSVNFSLVYEMFQRENAVGAFDNVYTESVSLPYWRARMLPNVAVTWHGIWYEIMHSKLFQELLADPKGELLGPGIELQEAMPHLLDEIRLFSSYSQHICISNSTAEVLRNIYQLPQRNVHVILNGVDEKNFVFDPIAGRRFREKYGVTSNTGLVIGVAGRLVRDKGHPLLYEAFSLISKQHSDVVLLVAGSGPWSKRYSELGPNVKVLGELEPNELSKFYNALDLFVNPTLRPQGLDLTLIEAMHCGKPVLATNFQSITGTVVLSGDYGYTFAPNVGSLVEALNLAIKDGSKSMQKKGSLCRKYALSMFTASKMALAYERFFLCMKNSRYCKYPLPTDC